MSFKSIIVDPRILNAAPTLRYRHPALVDDVFVNAEHGSEYGSDVERFLALVRSFNRDLECGVAPVT